MSILVPLKEANSDNFSSLQPSISHPAQSLNIPTFSTTMQYSRQCIAEDGVGAILVFEYLYFLLQEKDGSNSLQEDLNLAAEEYKSSGIHAKVNKLIQAAFQNHGDDVETLCPILVKIAQQNQLCKILFPYALPILTTAPSKDAGWEGLTEASLISSLFCL
ncbi:hypothetical protein BKA83DRAFT_4491262 [Pisolithus microcarpus]|nr:hypothetical protein BKA83DRAFT_4491262 [Pisolithus microcarpus]